MVEPATHPHDGRLSNDCRRAVYVVIALVFTARLLGERPDRTTIFPDRTNDPFFAAVAAEPDGLVLTAGGYQLVQLYTRRPVLLYGALDTLPYAPESGPEMQRIMQDVYGLDLFNPPESARGTGALPRQPHQALWESNSPERWTEIRRRWNVTQIIVPAAWTLQLPVPPRPLPPVPSQRATKTRRSASRVVTPENRRDASLPFAAAAVPLVRASLRPTSGGGMIRTTG